MNDVEGTTLQPAVILSAAKDLLDTHAATQSALRPNDWLELAESLDVGHMPRTFHVYIMASASRRLYVGVTGNILRRIHQHQAMEIEGFTKRYRMVRLVYVEATQDVKDAIRRE